MPSLYDDVWPALLGDLPPSPNVAAPQQLVEIVAPAPAPVAVMPEPAARPQPTGGAAWRPWETPVPARAPAATQVVETAQATPRAPSPPSPIIGLDAFVNDGM